MSKIKLNFATSEYDHFNDLANGRVSAQGIDLNVMFYEVEEIFFRMALHRDFDMSEMSFAKFVAQVSGDRPDIIGLPVFPSRVFRLSNIYVSKKSGIKKPGDLKGKKVGTPEWAQTASVYTRGWLTDHVGIKLSEIDWRQAGVDQAGRIEKVKLKLPKGVKVTPVPDKSLSEMLASGELDAAFSAHAPHSFLQRHPNVQRLFPNYREVEAEYYKKTKVFPIMHVIAIKKAILEENPWAAANLMTAFEAARANSIARVLEITASRMPIPWLTYEGEEKMKLLGDDYFPYGLEDNRVTLEAFLKWTYEQGIAQKHLKPEDLFPAVVRGKFRI
jgi:4,5-dihydroxyphthalate decarboxylase